MSEHTKPKPIYAAPNSNPTSTFPSYDEAFASLPNGSVWSSSFGNPGEGGFTEYWRAPDGKRYSISNGKWSDFRPFTWSVRTIN